MPQLYLFIGASLGIIIVITRRNFIFHQVKKIKFKKEVAKKVDELHKERQQLHKERFKEIHLEEQKGKKYDFSEYKLKLRRADVAMAKRQWNEAKKHLIQSLALTRDEFSVSIKLARVYLESGDLKRAEMLYKKLLEVEKDNPKILVSLARIYTKKKQYKVAIKNYVEAINVDDKNDKSFIGLGHLYQLLMRHSLAAECFRRAAELKPREVHYLFLLADSCREAEDYENALFAYERILTLEPYNEKAISAAQDMRIRMNEMERSIIA